MTWSEVREEKGRGGKRRGVIEVKPETKGKMHLRAGSIDIAAEETDDIPTQEPTREEPT